MTPSPKERIPSLVYDTSSTAAAGSIITLENPAMVESVVSTAHLNNKNKSMVMMSSSAAATTTSTEGKQATVPVTEQNQLRVRVGFLFFVSKKTAEEKLTFPLLFLPFSYMLSSPCLHLSLAVALRRTRLRLGSPRFFQYRGAYARCTGASRARRRR
jgi:hypothetical protein